MLLKLSILRLFTEVCTIFQLKKTENSMLLYNPTLAFFFNIRAYICNTFSQVGDLFLLRE